jgi:hypothetical protein
MAVGRDVILRSARTDVGSALLKIVLIEAPLRRTNTRRKYDQRH